MPCSTASPPSATTASTLIDGVVFGMTMTARSPRLRAASATPWAWLPAELQITPFASLAAGVCAILLYEPRSLNENTACRSSRFKCTS